ncbi:hypothetical protein [Aquabacterium sp.]|uniref:hypothetical protein n=1 Tax=Aquabacterium sp. TaxID=1872578 RepID=UPI002BF60195|nr:hypothetical protein [Aquabacterium sp.]HSW08605.1 hypothetical protein [Aquabacterium sp.]
MPSLAALTPDLTLTPRQPTRALALLPLRAWPAELLSRERRLALYGALLLVLLLPMALAWGLDDRLLRGANVWIKPMKFAASIGLMALTTAWFIGHLPAERRSSRAVAGIVWLLIGAGSFELAYITLQAGLGQGSHFNVGDVWHATMYTLMGIGAVVLAATQPMLAWQLLRHPDGHRPVAYRQAVMLGLLLSFVFGAGVGGLLSSQQPPDGGATVPLLGWALGGGDLRPAHFVGIHAAQFLPLIGFGAVMRGGRRAQGVVWLAAALYALLFAALVAWGLAGPAG